MPDRANTPTPPPARPTAPARSKVRNHLFEQAMLAQTSRSGAPGPMTRAELAEAVNAELARRSIKACLTDKDIGRYVTGESRWPRPHHRLALRAVLGVATDTDLGFYPNRRISARSAKIEPDIAVAVSEVVEDSLGSAGLALGASRRSLLTGIAAVAASCGLLGDHIRGRRLGVGDVERISAVTALYRSVDYEYGGGMLYVEVSRFAESASGLLDLTYSESLIPRLLSAVAAARQLAGWTAFDSCRHSDAQRHLLAAERAAAAADDPLLAARVRYCQARQYQHLRHNRDALDTLRLARDHVGAKSTAAVRAMLDGAQAASWAALGDGKQAAVLLGRAGEGFNDINIEREPDWMRFYDRGELLAQYGRVYRDLARVDRKHGDAAVRWTTEAIGAFNPQNARSSVLNEVGLCSALFLAGEAEQAVAVGARAIGQAQALNSPRIFDRLRNVRHDLAGRQAIAEVADFVQTLTALGPGATR